MIALNPPHRLRKGEAQAFDELKLRKIDVRKAVSDEMLPPAEHPHEEAEKLRQTLAEEMPRIGERLCLLAFIVKTVRNGVMAVLNLHHTIGNRELNLMCPEALAFIIRRKARAAARGSAGCWRSGRLQDHRA